MPPTAVTDQLITAVKIKRSAAKIQERKKERIIKRYCLIKHEESKSCRKVSDKFDKDWKSEI